MVADVQVSELLKSTLGGDTSAIAKLAALPDRIIKDASNELDLTLPASSVVTVLRELGATPLSASAAQAWASFIRRGYVSGGTSTMSKTRQPITIGYESGREGEIVEALARMDELGDTIDGVIEPAEIDDLVTLLTNGSG
jgi:hypothetical protein